MTGADMTQSYSLLLQPMTQTRGEQNLPVNRTPGISLRTLRLGKRADVCRERALECSRQNHLVVDDALHGGTPFSPARGRQGVQDYVVRYSRMYRKTRQRMQDET